MIVLDTDVVSAIMRAQADVVKWLDRQASSSVWTTTITLFEIRSGLAVMTTGRRRTAAEAAFATLIEHDLARRVLSFDSAAAEEAAALMAIRHAGGRIKDARDTMIAGIALAQNATLATHNIRHFDDLRVPVVDPWDG
jgi:predicted nucleic acid-binding protein